MSPLKEMFNRDFYRRFAATIKEVYPKFDAAGFLTEVTEGLSGRELNQRLRYTSITLQRFLPPNYLRAVGILKEAAPRLNTGYTALVLPDFVGLYGKQHFNESLEALRFFTRFGSSEFAIREFLKIDLHTTLKAMQQWANDENYHVRRLASEGSRPRLPWSFRLDKIVQDPSLTRPILHALRADNELYVRKSVANHLNDISKDHPDYLLQLVSLWDLDVPHTRWIVKHACRTLIKKGDPATLKLFSFHHNAKCAVSNFILKPLRLQLGETLRWTLSLKNTDKVNHKYAVDYALTYARGSGKTSRKVFKWKEITIAKNENATLSKSQVIRDFSTRKHYAGSHQLEILVNGKALASKEFVLQMPLPAGR